MRDSEIFDEAVYKFFEVLGRELGLELLKIGVGVYEMPSPHFILRIRLDTGHRRGLNVLLRPASLRDFDEYQPGSQLGIGCFIEFYGGKLQDVFINVDSKDDFVRQAQLLAAATREYLIPYLIGQGNDWEAVEEAVRRKTERDVEKIKNFRFPKNVREEWRLPEGD